MVNVIKALAAVTAMLSILKLSGNIASSWWVVTCLIWFPTAVILFIIATLMCVSWVSLSNTTRNLRRGRGRK